MHSGAPVADAELLVGPRYLRNALAFTPSLALVRTLWCFLVEVVDLDAFVARACFKSRAAPRGAYAVAGLAATLASHALLVVDDYELYAQSKLLPLRELRHAVRFYRDVLAHAEGIGVDAGGSSGSDAAAAMAAPAAPFWPRLAAAAATLLRALYDRHSQRPLGPPDMWLVDVSRAALCIPPPPTLPPGTRFIAADDAVRRLGAVMPFALAFDVRAAQYWAHRDAARHAAQYGTPQVRVTVHRSRLFESAYAALAGLSPEALRRKVYVTFINAEGMEESGIDAGGLFKELWTALAGVVFDPAYGMFRVTEAGAMYPNPDSALCAGVPDDAAFEFVGRVLGKAMFEGITIGPQFARFFLHKLLGRAVNLHYLSSLDPELYKSLMFLKTYDGDVADLALTFTVSGDLAAGADGHELLPGGAAMDVTAANRLQYIYLVADWRLNKAIERQVAAFARGMHDLVPAAWLAAFSAPELQVIISGAPRGVDAADLERAAQYGGGYHAVHSTVTMFWSVVAAFSERDRAALLKFVTSCERPPPSGFRQLDPPFTVVRLAARAPNDMLPMASTCFNMLKLPEYTDKATMRTRLLTAIHSGAGFEMT